MKKGHPHPLSVMMNEIQEIFRKIGFEVAGGPEIETEYYNFDALNIPAHHPARDMWDTFWLKPQSDGKLLRTHTSPVQIRYMENKRPPMRIISPGKVYRHEATDATHETQFYQLEGLLVDTDVSLGDLKGVLIYFFKEFFKKDIEVEFRPTFFPFVEPGVEIYMSCFKCNKAGCGTCKHTGWIEIMGAGMVHPKVLQNAGINPEKFKGFAFGGGLDRLAMMKYEIPDVRLLYTGDLRLINQF